jgi:hypothetical protein
MPDMPGEAKQEGGGHGGHFLIPAGALIGLGAGMLAGQVGAGVLIGLGLGFVGSEIYSTMAPRDAGSGWVPALVGIFLILVGLSLIWGPALPWTAIIAVFLILIVLGFIARGFAHRMK